MGNIRLHVLLLPSSYPTTRSPVSGIFFQDQAQILKQRGMKVGVLHVPALLSFKHPLQLFKTRIGVKIVDDEGIPVYRAYGINLIPKSRMMYHYLWRRLGLFAFSRYVKNYGMPDILHAHCALNGGVLGSYIKEKYPLPLVLTEHSTVYARDALDQDKRRMARFVFHTADCLISVSPSLATLLNDFAPNTSCRWEWIPNVVHDLFFQRKLDFPTNPSNPFVFLNIALMAEKKAQSDLLRAFSDAYRGSIETQLWIGGDGKLRSELESLTDKLGIRTQTRFLGMLTREEIIEAMHRADVFVLPSRYETFGLVLAEALATGTPVIATRCGGPECIVTSENGLLVAVNDVNELSKAMISMKRHVNRYSPAMLREDCWRRFGRERVVDRLQGIYLRLARNQSGAHSLVNSL